MLFAHIRALAFYKITDGNFLLPSTKSSLVSPSGNQSANIFVDDGPAAVGADGGDFLVPLGRSCVLLHNVEVVAGSVAELLAEVVLPHLQTAQQRHRSQH